MTTSSNPAVPFYIRHPGKPQEFAVITFYLDGEETSCAMQQAAAPLIHDGQIKAAQFAARRKPSMETRKHLRNLETKVRPREPEPHFLQTLRHYRGARFFPILTEELARAYGLPWVGAALTPDDLADPQKLVHARFAVVPQTMNDHMSTMSILKPIFRPAINIQVYNCSLSECPHALQLDTPDHAGMVDIALRPLLSRLRGQVSTR